MEKNADFYNKISWFLTLLMCMLSFIATAENKESRPTAKIALILDDVGGKPSDIMAFDLPTMVTFAILPNTSYSTNYSYIAASQGREVMLHMPMESLHGGNLGPNPLISTMYPEQLTRNLNLALENVPHAVGVNNHMGSKLTQITLSMRTIMQVLAERDLFFIDSVTTRYSKAQNIANEFGVKNGARHIFLDHEQNEDYIENQFNRLVKIAQKYGVAIGIGHPYVETLDTLPALIEKLPDNVTLVTVDSLMNKETDLATIFAKGNGANNQLERLKFAPQ